MPPEKERKMETGEIFHFSAIPAFCRRGGGGLCHSFTLSFTSNKQEEVQPASQPASLSGERRRKTQHNKTHGEQRIFTWVQCNEIG